ncbi:MAG TPA: divalent metal cation transporter [Clostridiales bacterium]|nr:divalent metal cation transporter [Clostridiales bacterium]
MNKKQSGSVQSASVLIAAAFLMATSAIGPGFLTQTATFTDRFHGSFGFVILISLLLAAVVQLNVWRVLCVSNLRGQDVANRVFNGLGYFVAALICLGGLAFNIGNVGGTSLGLNAALGLDVRVGYLVSGAIGIVVFLVKQASKVMDWLVKILGGIMIVVILIVIFIVQPPVGLALKETFVPSTPVTDLAPAILTLLGGTVGGYITFSGAHRLIDAGISGEENLGQITRSSVMGIGIASIVRIFLFLAVLGVVINGVTLDASNPAADAFLLGAGEVGYRFFGLVLWAAGTTSIVGAAYTSVSFLKTLSKTVNQYANWVTVAFIAVSTLIMLLLGQPAKLLVLAGALNGLILPVTLGVCLVASQKKDIMGENYKHPTWLFVAGIVVFCLSAYLGITSLGNLSKLFA